MTARPTSRAQPVEPRQPRGHVQDQILAQLRRGLMIGAFVPGQIMSLRKLAARFGTSPMPVREALTQLVAANALEEMPNRSVRVPRLSADRLRELFAIRTVIEGMAAKASCQKGSPQLITSLHAINQDLMRAISARDIRVCLATNQKFHFTLYRASGSQVFMPLIESLWLQCGPTMYFSFLAPDIPWNASAHLEVLDALRSGNPKQAQQAIARDIRTTAWALLSGDVVRSNDPLSLPADELIFDF